MCWDPYFKEFANEGLKCPNPLSNRMEFYLHREYLCLGGRGYCFWQDYVGDWAQQRIMRLSVDVVSCLLQRSRHQKNKACHIHNWGNNCSFGWSHSCLCITIFKMSNQKAQKCLLLGHLGILGGKSSWFSRIDQYLKLSLSFWALTRQGLWFLGWWL